MIKNINIKNFKIIKNVSINNCKQFNIIIGNNNVGKTTLLDYLFLTNEHAIDSTVAVGLFDKDVKKLEECIKEFDKNISSLEEDLIKKYCYIDNNNKKIPIQNLGTGLLNIFNTLKLSLASNNKILLLDNIEKSIHHSNNIKFIKMLKNINIENNNQIFLVTQSYEFISDFCYVFKDEKDDLIKCFRLDYKDNKHKVITYDKKLLLNAIDNWEVR